MKKSTREQGPNPLSVQDYVSGIRAGDRFVLSRAITLIESTRSDHQAQALDILDALQAEKRSKPSTLRIGITGMPGVGKSSFIEALGMFLIASGLKVAVLAVDPSSTKSKGSILGDKTRMGRLSLHEKAFVRPSPSSGELGGVALRTRETMLLCEAAGFDVTLIETVGVGQSETLVDSMVDFFLLLMLTGAGDELQGMKRGIMEMADLILITKADGDNLLPAQRARSQYQSALSLFPPKSSQWKSRAQTCSAHEGLGIKEFWEQVQIFQRLTQENGFFFEKRDAQKEQWFYESLMHIMENSLKHDRKVKKLYEEYVQKIKNDQLSPFRAAADLFQHYRSSFHEDFNTAHKESRK